MARLSALNKDNNVEEQKSLIAQGNFFADATAKAHNLNPEKVKEFVDEAILNPSLHIEKKKKAITAKQRASSNIAGGSSKAHLDDMDGMLFALK